MAAKSTTGAEIRRVYEPADSYGYRALADRLRPRGVRRDDGRLDEWAKEVAPSDAQRGLQHPASAAKTARSAQSRFGRATWLRSTATSWRGTMISASLDSWLRASSKSQPNARIMIR
jgi:hypothetical protein